MVEEEYTVAIKEHISGYSNKLLDNLCLQWKNVSFCDMFIVTRNKHLPVHACVMSAFSSRVSAHIAKSSGTFAGRKLSPPYIMKVEYSYEVIDAIVRALYTGVFCPPTSALAEVYAAVEWLDIFELSQLLKKHCSIIPHGNASELENTNCEVSMDTNIQTGKLLDSVVDYISNDGKVPDCIITNLTSIEQKSPVPDDLSLESKKNNLVPIVRRTARKRKSLPYRYNQEQFILDRLEKVCPPEKFCDDASLSDSLAAEPGEENKPDNEASVHQGQKDLLLRGALIKDNLSRMPVDSLGQILLSGSFKNKAEIADSEKTTPLAPDLIKTPRTVADKHPTLSSKLNKNKSDVPVCKEIVTTVIAEVSDADPIKNEIDLLIGDIEIKKCEKCFTKFSNLDMYVAHISDHPVFKCSVCCEVFFRKSNYTKHQRDRHLGRPYLKCRLCGHQSQNEVQCRSHSDEVHGERKPFTCEKEGCHFRARKYQRLHLHMKTHSQEKDFCCEKCGQRFSQIWSLQSHHNACYQLGSFLCDLCGQSFNHQQSMKIHRRTMHLFEKPYPCKICAKQFSHHGNLKRHMRIHNNSFPYSCSVCKQSFRHSNTLKAHMSSRHKEVRSFNTELNSEASNGLGGFSYKRKLKSRSVSKVAAPKAGSKRLKRGGKGSRFAASSPQMFQTCSLSEGDALPSPEETHFIIDGLDLDEDVMSNSNTLDSLDTKQLDLSGENSAVELDNVHFKF